MTWGERFAFCLVYLASIAIVAMAAGFIYGLVAGA